MATHGLTATASINVRYITGFCIADTTATPTEGAVSFLDGGSSGASLRHITYPAGGSVDVESCLIPITTGILYVQIVPGSGGSCKVNVTYT